MSDVNANIGVHIDTSAALAELKNLQRQLAQFHAQVSKSSAAAAAAQKNLQTNLLNTINATGKFRAQMGIVRTSTESFTDSLERNKFSMREYFRYAGGATKTFGRMFKSEFDTIGKVAEERVKRMQTQYIKMGRDATGAMRSMAITPTSLDMKNYGTQAALAAQRQQLFNQLVKQGSTNLLNFGKNTQWAGRQLMVGFTIPLMYFGSVAAKTFMDLEAQAIKFRRVYGDTFTTTEETNKALKDIQDLAAEFTKYGVAVAETMEMAASAAAMGKTGAELTAQVAEATRLAVLGGVEQQQALDTTISLTNAFGLAADQLAGKIDFLNAVENQTVTAIEDLTIAIPKAGPVVQQLGGSVEDLAFFLTAMREGGINASEGANALKSGLASLINPTDKAKGMLKDLGINIDAIVEGNAGNLKEIVIDFAESLDKLAPLDRSRAIEQLFGKFQFARLSTLFQNVTKDGTQAARVLELSGKSVEELAVLSERELKKVEDAVGVNFKEAVEQLKVAIAPIGKTFLETVTPIIRSLGGLFEKFNDLSDGTKKFIVVATTLVGLIGPTLLMTFGLVANGAANIIKLFLALRTGFLKLTGNSTSLAQQTQYLTMEQMEAATVAASLNQAHNRLTQQFLVEAEAVSLLRNAYVQATVAAAKFAAANPGMMAPGFKGIKGGGTQKFASGTTEVVGGQPGKDSVLSLLTPGEAVIPAGIAQDDVFKPIVEALVTGKIKGFNEGTVNVGGRSYTTRSQGAARNLEKKISQLISQGISEEKIARALDKNIERGRPMTASALEKRLSIGRGSSAGTSAPSGIKRLARESQSGFRNETRAIRKILKQKGITLTPAQEKNLFNVQASHIEEVRNAGVKQWSAANLVADLGYVNNYLNTVKGNLGKNLLAMSDDQLRSLGIDRKELQALQSGRHPTTASAASTLRAVARYDASINPRSYQAQAVLAGLEYRSKTNFYAKPLPTLADKAKIKPGKTPATFAVSKGETVETTSGKRAKVTGQTGIAKPSGMRVVGGGAADRRVISGSNIASIFPRGFKGPRLVGAGAIDGFNTPSMGIKSGGAPKVSQDQERAIKANTEALDETTKQTKTIGQKFNTGANVFAGLTIVGSFMGGQIGELSQKLAPLAIGLSTIAMLLPSLKSGIIKFGGFLAANPFVAVALAIAGIAVAAKVVNEKMKKQARAQSDYIDAISATTEKMKKVGEITGEVGASQVMQMRREGATADKFTTGYDRAGQQFGTTFVESAVGKDIVSTFQNNLAKGGTNAVKQIALQLSSYVSDGLMSAEDANSVARAIGIQMSDMALAANIQGEIRSIIGPNGEDLLKDPLKVRLEIVEASRQNIQDYLNAVRKEMKNIGTGGDAYDVGFARDMVAAGAASGTQALESLQAQRDAQAKLTDDKIRELQAEKAKTQDKERQKEIEKEIAALVSQQSSDDRTIAGQRAKIIQDQLKLFREAQKVAKGETAFFESAKQQVTTKFEGDPFVKKFLEESAGLDSKELEVQLLTVVGAGDLTPKAAINFMEIFGDKEAELEAVINSKIVTENPDKFAQLNSIAGGLKGKGSKKIALDIMTKLTAEGGEDKFDDRLAVLNLLQKMDGKELNVAAFLKGDITGKLDKLSTDFNKIEKKKTINIEVLDNLKEELGVDMSGLIADWDHYINLPDDVKKTVTQTYVAIYKSIGDKEASEFIASQIEAAGGSQLPGNIQDVIRSKYMNSDGSYNLPAISAELTKPQFAAGKTPNTVPTKGSGNKGDGSKNRDTTLDALLNRLKFVRDASIKATGGIQELLKITSKGGISKFGGVIQQLSAGPKGGFNREFISFLESMDDKTRQTYMTIKNGQVVLTKQGKALKEAFNEQVIGDYQAAQTLSIQDTLAQRAALLKLKSAGVDNATALEMVADASLAVAINSKDISSKELKNMADKANQAKKEIKDLNLEVQNLGQSVKDRIGDLNTTVNALSAARASGITSQELLQYIASNQALADQIVSKGINDPVVQDLIKNQPKIEDLEGAIDGLVDPLQKIQSDFDKARDKADKFYQFLENQANASYKKWLQDTKFTFEGVAYSIETALQKAQDKIAEYQEQIDDANREVELEFDRPMDALREQIDDIQRNIELQFDRPIEGLQREINGLQRQIEEQFDRPIQALQDESGRLSNDLSIMDRAAQAINEKYDAQEEALNKISEINQDIIAQEKQRISLADAITQGDISAAAQAAQDMRAAAAASAAQRAGGTLTQAREAEIAGLRTAGGLTRAQVEERQFQISQQIFNLEQGRAKIQSDIQLKQDAIYRLEQAKIPLLDQIRGLEDQIYILQERKEEKMLAIRDLEDEIYNINEDIIEPITQQVELRERALQAELDAIEAQRAKWDETQTAIDEAKLKADGFDTTMKGIESKTANMLSNWNSIESKVVELTIIEKRVIEEVPGSQTGGGGGGGAGGAGVGAAQVKMYGGKIKPMAYGGRVGSDFVPALLTPGEFVVNKFAAKQFGPLLESINGSKYPSLIGGGSLSQPSYGISSGQASVSGQSKLPNVTNSNSVYNYNVGITVNGTNINPNSIARSVIDQIKYVDSQRIVGQRAG